MKSIVLLALSDLLQARDLLQQAGLLDSLPTPFSATDSAPCLFRVDRGGSHWHRVFRALDCTRVSARVEKLEQAHAGPLHQQHRL